MFMSRDDDESLLYIDVAAMRPSLARMDHSFPVSVALVTHLLESVAADIYARY